MKISDIEKYLTDLEKKEMDFKNQSCDLIENDKPLLGNKFVSYFKNLSVISKSITDYISLLFLLKFKKSFFKNKRLIYTARNFCTLNNGILEDRIIKPIFQENIIFISHAKGYTIKKINNQRVFNIGGAVKLISKFGYQKYSQKIKYFLAYKFVNNSILKELDGNEVYSLCYYDLNGISLSMSEYRYKIKFGEVQHGSIINYPPYTESAPFKIVDIFYVKNSQTIDYLRGHLCSKFEAEYNLIPYPKVDRKIAEGVNVFYASTVEFNGFHPVFIKFLERNSITNLNIIVRLHPREKDKEEVFKVVLEKNNIKYEFDNSQNWLENNKIKNLIVVSPWSSSIEDSYDNEFITITIDPVGKERYSHLIDNKKCFYSCDLSTTIENILSENIVNESPGSF